MTPHFICLRLQHGGYWTEFKRERREYKNYLDAQAKYPSISAHGFAMFMSGDRFGGYLFVYLLEYRLITFSVVLMA